MPAYEHKLLFGHIRVARPTARCYDMRTAHGADFDPELWLLRGNHLVESLNLFVGAAALDLI